MHILLSFSYLTALLLTYSVLASPTPLSRIGTSPQGINTINPAPSNTTLGFIPPQGLRDFECWAVAVSDFAIEPKNMFLTFLKLLEEITQGDFNSPLDRPTQYWKGPNNLMIFVKSVNDQPTPRRFLMWGIVRILWTMKHEPRFGFHTGKFEAMWHARKVADIEVAYTSAPTGQPSSGITTKNSGTPSMSRASTNITATVVGDVNVAWVYTPFELVPGEPHMTQWDVAVGSIGAMLYAAQHTNHNFDQFSGDHLPTALAVSHYRTVVHPSRLSKSILIRTIAQAAIWALNEGEFHRLSVRVLDLANARDIARGGYGPPGLVPTALRESISAADS